MATTTTPLFTDTATAVVAATTVAAGASARGTIDLRGKFGAWVFLRVGWLGTTAPGTAALDLLVRRTINNNGVGHPGAVVARQTSTGSGSTLTSQATNASSSIADTTLSSASNWTTVGIHGSVVFIGGNSGTVSNYEWARVSKFATTTLTLDAPMKKAHASSDTVVNGADCFAPVWLAGGSVYECIFDYGASTTGSSVYVEALATTYDSESSA
jgi:hypothetical protein